MTPASLLGHSVKQQCQLTSLLWHIMTALRLEVTGGSKQWPSVPLLPFLLILSKHGRPLIRDPARLSTQPSSREAESRSASQTSFASIQQSDGDKRRPMKELLACNALVTPCCHFFNSLCSISHRTPVCRRPRCLRQIIYAPN